MTIKQEVLGLDDPDVFQEFAEFGVKTELKVEPDDDDEDEMFDQYDDEDYWMDPKSLKKKSRKRKKAIKVEDLGEMSKKKRKKRVFRPKVEENLDDGVEYQCYKCGDMITSRRSVMEHQRKEHKRYSMLTFGTELRTHQCHQCKAMFKSENSMLLHFCNIDLDRKWGEPYNCKTCNKTFTRVDGLKKHVSIVHTQVSGERTPRSEAFCVYM